MFINGFGGHSCWKNSARSTLMKRFIQSGGSGWRIDEVRRMHKFRIICLMIGVTRSFCPSWNRVDMESETLPRRESQYFSESTAVLRRKYSSTLGAVLEYFHRSTRVFLLEYSSIPTGVLWHPSILLPRLPFPVRKAGDDLIPCAMEYSHPIRIKSLTKPPGPTKVRKIFFK